MVAQIKVNTKNYNGFIDAKFFLKSKTVWLNMIALIIPVLDIVLKTNFITDKDVYALVLAIFNILIRFRTIEPITIKHE